MVLETRMGKKNGRHGTRLTKSGRSFINSRALSLKRQCQIFDGMVTWHATQQIKRENHTRWPTAPVLAIHNHAFCFHQGIVHFTTIVDQHLWIRQDFVWFNERIVGEYHVHIVTARVIGSDVNAPDFRSVGFAVDKLFDPRIRPAMGSVGTNDDSFGQRIVSLKVLVGRFIDACCHCTVADFTECQGEWSRLVATCAINRSQCMLLFVVCNRILNFNLFQASVTR